MPTGEEMQARRRLGDRSRGQGGIYYTGTKEDLMAAGLGAAKDFPGDGAGNRASKSVVRGEERLLIKVHTRGKTPVVYRVFVTAASSTSGAQGDGEGDNEDGVYDPVIAEDAEWPPAVSHLKSIKRGDGSKWHYLASPEVLELEGVLDPKEIPGNPACKSKFYHFGWHDNVWFIASRIGDKVAVTILGKGSALIYCRPLAFRPR